MPILGQDYQAKTKNADNVLVGVAQVRCGLPSDRSAVTAVVSPLQAVTQSTTITDTTDGVTQVVRPTRTPNTGSITAQTVSGTYTGKYDGAFILRCSATGATGVIDVYAPNGYKQSFTLASSAIASQPLKLNATDASGVTLSATFSNHAVGDTWIIPVSSGNLLSLRQTGIVSPYSLFQGSANSVGGLKSASFTPKIDGVKLLETGFPAEIDDRIITKTSATLKFEAFEYTNATLQYLRDMVSQIINESRLPAVPMEVVMRTRGNSLVSFWLPCVSMASVPTYAPTDDYSTLPWELEAVNQTEISINTPGFSATTPAEIATYNAWLRNTFLFYELQYIH